MKEKEKSKENIVSSELNINAPNMLNAEPENDKEKFRFPNYDARPVNIEVVTLESENSRQIKNHFKKDNWFTKIMKVSGYWK